MSVFDFQEPATEETEASENPSDRDSDPEKTVKSVTVMESSDGHGGTRHRSYIPAAIARALDLSGGDILLMEHVEGSDEIRVRKP